MFLKNWPIALKIHPVYFIFLRIIIWLMQWNFMPSALALTWINIVSFIHLSFLDVNVHGEKSKNQTSLIVGVTVGITVALILCVTIVVCYRRKRASYQYNVFYDEQNIVMNPFDGPKWLQIGSMFGSLRLKTVQTRHFIPCLGYLVYKWQWV